MYSEPWKNDICIVKVMKWIYRALTMSIYIRIITEAFIIVCISVMTDFKSFDTHTLKNVLSLVTSLFLLSCIILFLVVNVYLIRKVHWNFDENVRLWYEELFSGLKETTKGRLNSIIFLVSRFLFVFVVVAFEDIPVVVKVIMFGLIQACYVVYLVIVRPFEQVKDNIIEWFNQISYLFLVSSLVFLNTEEKWGNMQKNTYMYTLILVSLFGPLMSIIFLIFVLTLKTKRWIATPKTRVTQEPTPVESNVRVFEPDSNLESGNALHRNSVCDPLLCRLILII
jgi:hypothetical protein